MAIKDGTENDNMSSTQRTAGDYDPHHEAQYRHPSTAGNATVSRHRECVHRIPRSPYDTRQIIELLCAVMPVCNHRLRRINRLMHLNKRLARRVIPKAYAYESYTDRLSAVFSPIQ